MFNLFKKDPVKKLQKEYEALSTEAMKAQRNGNIALFAKLSQKLDALGKQIDQLKE